MSDDMRQPPLWKIWANPIFVRYARSRLRPAAIITWAIVVLIAASFSFFLFYLTDVSRGQGTVRGANDAFVPVLVIQMVLLMLMGTGSVATGITREADDGMSAYMRLTPMTPLAKIIGYLFGLPIREYVLFACTLPFTVYSISAGSIGLDRALEIYLILFSSAVLYHLTGCVAGTVVANRRFAGRVAQLLVVLLYFVLPGLSKLGFVFFEYLTLRPVMFENLQGVDMPAFGALFGGISVVPAVSFFDFEFTRTEFTLIIQASLILSFVLILYRKWRQQTHHLLGKNFSVLLYFWILLLMVGNAIPMMESRSFFPRVWNFLNDLVDPRNAYIIASCFGLGVLLLAFAFISVITPTTDEYTKGLRRARKLGLSRLGRRSDGAGATPYVLLIAAIGALIWSYFLREIFASPIVADVPHSERMLRGVPVGLLLYMLCYHGVLERFGRRALLLFALFVWVVPVLGGVILAATQVGGLPIFLGSISAFAAPFYLLVLPMQEGDLNGGSARLMQIGIRFSMFAHLLFVLFLTYSLRNYKRRIRSQVERS